MKARKDATFQGNGLPAAVVRMAQDGNALAMSCCHEFIAMELVRSIRRVSLTADKDTEAALLQAADEAEWFMFTLKGKNDDI